MDQHRRTRKVLKIGNIIQCATERGKLLERGDVLVADINMWMSLSHPAKVRNMFVGIVMSMVKRVFVFARF